jgi:glycosyltransferase involved in cell wall biosynthesis
MTGRRVVVVLEPFPIPAGGVAVIYRHAEILAECGIPAYVALPERPPTDFYGSHAPLLVHHGRLPVQAGDVFVIPEGFTAYVKALTRAPVKRLMFCQNQYYLPFTADAGAGFAEFGVHGVIASSEAVRRFFSEVYGLTDVPLIPCAIDTATFAPGPVRRRRQIAFMPRKLPDMAAFIQAVFRRRHGRYADVPWVAIEHRTQRETAEILAESDVFLSLSHKESLGLPPLEAMACGCLVAGFHGDGGREYMTEDNGWWAETGDWKACVDGLAAALDLLQHGGDALVARRRAMAATVGRYSPERMKEALLGFWRQELTKPFPEGTGPIAGC